MKTRIYLNYLSNGENERMTKTLRFLQYADKLNLEIFTKLANEIYGKGIDLDFVWDNGHYPYEWRANHGELHFYTVMMYKKNHLTEQAIEVLGYTNDRDFPYYYGISLCKEDRKLYLVSFSDRCSPNWNKEYRIRSYHDLQTVNFPILTKEGTIYRMDDALHAAINERLARTRPMFVEDDDKVVMVVKDQHGNYADIEGKTLDDVFRNYADNYTGYRNYRRQMASEWEIVDNKTRKKFEEWKQTAQGLKSDFDKFYGGGIVD